MDITVELKRAQAEAEAGHPEKSVSLLKAMRAETSTDPLLRFSLAGYQLRAGEVEQGTQSLLALWNSLPPSKEVATELAYGLLLTGQVEAYRQYLDRLRKDSIFSPHFWSELSQKQLGWDERTGAMQSALTAVEADPRSAEYRFRLAIALLAAGSPSAIQQLQTAYELDPQHKETLWQLFEQARQRSNCSEMSRLLDQMSPVTAPERVLLGRAYVARLRGDYQAAIAALDQAIEIAPDCTEAHAWRIYYLAYHFPDRISARRQAAKAYASQLRATAVRLREFSELDRNPERPLRVGVIGNGFHGSPAIGNLQGWFRHRSADISELLVFQRAPHKQDDISEELKKWVDEWVYLPEATDAYLASQLTRYQLDILIDINWVMEHPNFAVFAHRVAPVQLCWLNCEGFCDLPEVDGIVISKYSVCAGGPEPVTEPVYSDHSANFRAADFADVAGIAPEPTRSGLTFGSFNTHWKLNDTVFAVWAELLRRVPEARLLIKSAAFDSEEVRQIYRDRALAAGIPRDRLEVRGPVSRLEHFKAINEIDVMLDPFPFQGGVSVMEALWMGVPVVALHGDHPSQRTGLGFLSISGHPEWSVSTTEDYLQLAEHLIRDRTLRRSLKPILRAQLLSSDAMDGRRQGVEMGQVIRQAWRAAYAK